MPPTGRHGAAGSDFRSKRRRPPDPVAPALLLVVGLGAAVLLIVAWALRVEIAALLAWSSSPEPWWRP